MSSLTAPSRKLDMVVGTGIVLVAKWYSDADGATPADPTTVTFRVQLPSDDTDDVAYVVGTDAEATKLSTGIYEFRYAAQEAGFVDYQAVATGAIVDTQEIRIRYRESAFDAVPGPGA